MERFDDFTARIDAQKRAMQAAKGRKGQKATSKASRYEIELTYINPVAVPANLYKLRTCFIAFAYPPSRTPVQDLEPIKLSELRLETRHVGRVLIVRIFTPARRIVSVQAGIEDEDEDVDHIGLYNADPKLKAEQILPEDAVFAVKEPYYKPSASGGYMVRVDHPSDLVQLPDTHDLVPLALQPRLIELEVSVESIKLEGNKAFKAKDYLSALERYTQGISKCGEDDRYIKSDLLRNRSIANLHLQRYESAAADAVASIVSYPELRAGAKKNNAKAHYRAGCALYHQENFDESLGSFKQSLEVLPDDTDCLREIKRTESRLRLVLAPDGIEEQTTGVYDFAAISKTASSKHNRLDHASFLANVKVGESDKKGGRGLFTTSPLKAGDLILCEKAFLVSFHSDAEAETYTIMNLNTNVGVMGTQATLMFNLTQKTLHNPTAAVRFFDLFDGGYTPKCKAPQVDGVTVVDTFQLASIREQNAFGCSNMRSTDKHDPSEMDHDPRSATGVWITASYINHACDGNAIRSFIGDLMIVRATKDIAEGAEITMPYRMAEADNKETRKALEKTWGFKCRCDLCVVEMKTGGSHTSKRRQLSTEAETLLENNPLNPRAQPPSKELVAKAQKLYDQLAATYDKTLFKAMPRLGLVDLGLWLINAQTKNANPKNVVDRAVETLRNCGYVVEVKGKEVKVDHQHCLTHAAAEDAAVHAAQASFFNGDDVLGKQFEELAKKLYVMRLGELRGYKERYGGSTT